VYRLNPEGTEVRTQRITGWLVQHQYDNPDRGIPSQSRVIPGMLNADAWEVKPLSVDRDFSYIGIYPAGECPCLDELRASQGALARRRRRDTEPRE
jgi:hypothetical protein